jgi:hypothetical protein
LILTVGARLSFDFKIATTTIPLVTAVIDPIAIGLAAKQRFNWQMTLYDWSDMTEAIGN